MDHLSASTNPSIGTLVVKGPSNSPHVGREYRTAEVSDIVISAGEHRVKAHKVALKLSCPGLRDKLSEQEISLDIRPSILDLVINFVYTNEVDIPDLEADLREVATVAKSFGVEALYKECTRKTLSKKEVTPENCVGLLIDAHGLNDGDLQEKFLKVALFNFSTIKDSTGFKTLPEDLLKRYILHKDLMVRAPELRLSAALKWVRVDVEGRKKTFSDLLDSPVFVKRRMDTLCNFLHVIRFDERRRSSVNELRKTVSELINSPEMRKMSSTFVEHLMDDPIIEQLPKHQLMDLLERIKTEEEEASFWLKAIVALGVTILLTVGYIFGIYMHSCVPEKCRFCLLK